jgi:hypothetical protein
MKLFARLGPAALACGVTFAAVGPAVFPAPREMELRGAGLRLDEAVPILLPEKPSAEDLFLARFLTTELAERYGVALHSRRTSKLPEKGPFLLLGSSTNPLIKEHCRKHGAAPSQREGYLLQIDDNAVVVAGADDPGAFYGLQSLRQLIGRTSDGVRVPGARIRDWPFKPFRAIKVYLPGRDNIAYFKRFVRDLMALYKYNTVILEVNGGMRLDRHPEVNAGWIELSKNLNYTRRDRAFGPGRQFQDSANADAADGGVLEKDEVADLVRFARQNHVDVMPEIPSLTHSYYLLTRHRELAEIQDAEWPDTYCPSELKVYDLLFDVLDEYIEVMHPSMVHIGHDEWRMPFGVCRRCRGKDPRELYAADVNRIYSHLRTKGVATAIYGDHLIEPLRGKKLKHVDNSGGTPYDMPGALSPEEVLKLIPKDILIFNWFWDEQPEGQGEGETGLGEKNEIALSKWGFRQVFGNFEPHIKDFDRRAAKSGIIGGAPSSWAATNELNFGKDLMFDFLGCANLLWSADRPDSKRLAAMVQDRLPDLRYRLSAVPLPSFDRPAAPIRIETGKPVPIREDPSSLIFVHSCRKRARNGPAYYATWNYADSADLLGWYEVVYDDGFIVTVPIRYGVNILEESWPSGPPSKNLAYEARLVPRSGGQADFAYEWINPRFGKVIREVRLKSASVDNPVKLGGLSLVRKLTPPEPKPLRKAE